MKKIPKEIIHFSLTLLVICMVICCSKDIDGKYKLVKGDCHKFLLLKNLGDGKYNVIVDMEGVEKCEILGEIKDNTISGFAGNTPIQFIIQDNRVLLKYQDNKCLFEKVK